MILKGILHILDEHQEGLPPGFLMRENALKIKTALDQAQAKIKKGSAVKQEMFQAIKIMTDVISGPPSKQRSSIAKFCLNFLAPKKDKIFKDAEYEDFKYYFWKNNFLAQYQIIFKDVCDCSFLYWTKDLLPLFFGHIAENPLEMKRIKFLNLAIEDCHSQLLSIQHLDNTKEIYNAFKEEVLEHFYNVNF